MKKATNFGEYISIFLMKHLPEEKGMSRNTINTYRDCFVLLLNFLHDVKQQKIENLTLEKIKKETIIDFLDWIEIHRKCSISTRNSRLAAIHSFYKFLQKEKLEYLNECQKIIEIGFKKAHKETMSYLTLDGIALLLKQPNTKTKTGRRDLALLSLMYDTGARVQEMIDLTPSNLMFNKPSIIKIIGKGNKARLVPLLDAQTDHIKNYMREQKLNEPHRNLHPLFSNNKNEKLTRAGINFILKKYILKATKENESLIPKNISCHSLRHSKAMHLLQAGVNLVYIRDILGHSSVTTTEVYARADSMHKRIALEKAYVNVNPTEKATWIENKDLMTWLKSF